MRRWTRPSSTRSSPPSAPSSLIHRSSPSCMNRQIHYDFLATVFHQNITLHCPSNSATTGLLRSPPRRRRGLPKPVTPPHRSLTGPLSTGIAARITASAPIPISPAGEGRGGGVLLHPWEKSIFLRDIGSSDPPR